MPQTKSSSHSVLARAASRFFLPHRRRIALILVLALSTSVLAVSEPLLYKLIVDSLGNGFSGVTVALLVGLALALVTREGLAALIEFTVSKIRIALNFDMLKETNDRLHSLPLDHHGGENSGAVLSRIERGVAGSVQAFSEIALHLVPSLAYLALSAVVMVRLEWHLTLLVLAFAPVPALLGAWASHEQIDRERALMSRWVRIFGRLNEVLSGITVIRSFVKEEDEKRRFISGVHDANDIARRGYSRDARVNATKNATMALARVCAVALGGCLVARHQMSLGTLLAFLGYVGGVFAPVQALTGMYQTVRKGSVALEAVSSILDAQESHPDTPGAHDAEHLRGDVTFEHVRFGYRKGPKVLRDVNLRVRAGETVALVGRSGAGKSTLMALLQRLYEPDAGRILLDGVDIRAYKQRSLRSQIGVVSQDGMLFDDTIRDNIAFGRPGASFEEIERVARAAHAHEFITKLPQGYDTRVGYGGSLLSGGERQRIAIARALLKDAPILVLDEATSALDAESEDLVREALERLTKGRTTFVIAHRASALVQADRIAYVEGGTIVEAGTHRELVRSCEPYAKLIDRQVRTLEAVAA